MLRTALGIIIATWITIAVLVVGTVAIGLAMSALEHGL